LGLFCKKTPSTVLHACKNIEKKLTADETLRRQISMVERNINA
jgi:chromosomal replication initiator protein